MKFTLASAVIALAAGATAQGLNDIISQIPGCALICLSTATASSQCGLTDATCLCNARETITATVLPCLNNAGCSQADINAVTNLSNQLCSDLANGSSIPSITLPTPTNTPRPTVSPAAADRVQAAAWAGAAVALAAFAL